MQVLFTLYRLSAEFSWTYSETKGKNQRGEKRNDKSLN